MAHCYQLHWAYFLSLHSSNKSQIVIPHNDVAKIRCNHVIVFALSSLFISFSLEGKVNVNSTHSITLMKSYGPDKITGHSSLWVPLFHVPLKPILPPIYTPPRFKLFFSNQQKTIFVLHFEENQKNRIDVKENKRATKINSD